MIKLLKYFSYNQNVVPWGLSALDPGLYTCIKGFGAESLCIAGGTQGLPSLIK